MKILKESNEKLPINVVTDFVSEGWNEVGKLKSEIEAVKGFKGSDAVVEVLQKLTDSYLVCIGQLEAFLADKKYIKEPEELKENAQLNEQKFIYSCDPSQLEGEVEADTEEEAVEKAMEKCAEKGIYVPDEIIDVQPETAETGFPETPVEVKAETPTLHDKFEYFVDFDDVDLNSKPISDAEIEQLQKIGQ